MLLLASFLIAAAVAVLVLAFTWSRQATGVARSLELITYRPDPQTMSRHELSARDRFIVPVLEATSALARRLSPRGAEVRLSRSLDRAGNPQPWTVERVYGAKGLGLMLGALLPLFISGLNTRGVLFAAGVGVSGFFLPDLLVYNAGLRRQEELSKGLADALDMLTVCVEAGQGFDAATLHVARTVPGPIGGELARVLSEVQIGKSRAEAFADLAERAHVPQVRNFVSALVQADRMGVPIASVLREQTRHMRLTRRQKAEEAAQKVTVKILFPVLLCIFPTIFVVIIGPGVIRIVGAFARL